jgi:DNA-binding response OmpR family regulator
MGVKLLILERKERIQISVYEKITMPHTIMIVEDDQSLFEYLQKLLIEEGYSVWGAHDSMGALDILNKKAPDLVLLDLGLPNVSGETLLQEIRDLYPDMKIIILTGKDRLDDVVQGFSLGADDYIKKPFQTAELLARIKARLRSGSSEESLHAADLEMNLHTLEVTRGGQLISLTPQEFKLLQYLLTNQGRVLTRDMILSRLWGCANDVESRVVDVYIGYLRKKIDTHFEPKLIKSVRGFGYMLKA